MTPPSKNMQHLLAVRKRLYLDFEFYCRTAVKIRTKDGQIKPLILNEAQKIALNAILKQWQETGRVRAIISKGRQQGMSTMIQAFAYWLTSQRRAFKSLVIAHEAEASTALFTMTKRIHENMPEILKMHTKYSSKKELYFDVLDSGYRVATAGNESAARGETLQLLHASEMAFWPTGHAEELWNGLIQAVPNQDNTFVFIESTSNGVGNLYHRMWQQAVSGENGYIPIFVPWYLQPEYRMPVPENFQRTEEEQALAEKYGLDDAQLMFRRVRIAETSADQFKQEYPFTAEESFLTSGRPVFNPDDVLVYRHNVTEPLYHMDNYGGMGWEKVQKGPLAVFEEPKAQRSYTIGVDVSYGFKDGDWSVAQVLDDKGNQVARWRGHLNPEAFAEVLAQLGELYHNAYIVVENNNVGFTTVNRLFKELGYANVHRDVQEVTVTDRETVRLGFNTNAKTKPAIINHLRQAISEHRIRLPDVVTVEELSTYVVDEHNKLGAEHGYHDDCVMALAIALYHLRTDVKTVEPVDDYYVEMV